MGVWHTDNVVQIGLRSRPQRAMVIDEQCFGRSNGVDDQDGTWDVDAVDRTVLTGPSLQHRRWTLLRWKEMTAGAGEWGHGEAWQALTTAAEPP